MTCPHCNSVLATGTAAVQVVPCHRCGAGYTLILREDRAPTVTPERLKALFVTNT